MKIAGSNVNVMTDDSRASDVAPCVSKMRSRQQCEPAWRVFAVLAVKARDPAGCQCEQITDNFV
jgi:hypothetical protein